MAITHIEVANAKTNRYVQTGQCLAVIPERETPCFYWVRAFDGTALKVSKKTKRICGTDSGFFKSHRQPLMNF